VGDYSFGFNGKDKESEFNSGAYDFGARIHDARLGRWMSVDPRGDEYVSISPYSFVSNSPLCSLDPDGEYIKPANRDAKDRIDARLNGILQGSNISLIFNFENPLVPNEGSGTKYTDYTGQNRPIPVITISSSIRSKLNIVDKSFNISYRRMRRAIRGVLRDNGISIPRRDLNVLTNYAQAASSTTVHEVVFIDEQITMNDSNVDAAQGDGSNDLGPYVTSPLDNFMSKISKFENSSFLRRGGVDLNDPVLVSQKKAIVQEATPDNGGGIEVDSNGNTGTTIFIDKRATDSNGSRQENTTVSENRLDNQIKKVVNGK
jgi:RHS repeat-associated protein